MIDPLMRPAGMAVARLLRALAIASALALLLHFLNSYFDWHLFSEADGVVVIAIGPDF